MKNNLNFRIIIMAFFVWCGCNHPNPTVSEKEHSSQEHKCQPEFFLTETVVRKGRDTVIFKYVLNTCDEIELKNLWGNIYELNELTDEIFTANSKKIFAKS